MPEPKTIADINRMGKLLAPLYRERDGYGFKYQVTSIQSAISQSRKKNRDIPKMGTKQAKPRIYAHVLYILNQLRQRTHFTVKVGEGRKEGEKTDRSKIRVDVNWMWERRVWEPFYKGRVINLEYPSRATCLIPNHLFVLDAEEVKVNHRRARMYEALLFDLNTGENYTRYITTATVDGKDLLEIGVTPAAAIRTMETMMTHIISQRMEGAGA